jgi:hypothetical protein
MSDALPTTESTAAHSEDDLVRDEALALSQYRPKITPAELTTMRVYAWRRARFPKAADQLSVTEAAWRRLFFVFDRQLEDSLGTEMKQRFDAAEMHIQELKLAKRMMAFSERRFPNNKSGRTAVWTVTLLLAIVTYFIGHSFFVTLTVAIACYFAGLFISSTVFDDLWSVSRASRWLSRGAKVFRSQNMEAGAARMWNRVLHADEYERTGDSERAADCVKAVERFVSEQDALLGASVSFLSGPQYTTSVTDAEHRIVQSDVSAEDRVKVAKSIIGAVESVRAITTKELNRINEDAEAEIYELERQVSGLPAGSRKDRLSTWCAIAKREYLNGCAARNILYNKYDLDTLIAKGVVDHNGTTDFGIPVEQLTESLAQYQFLPQLRDERDRLIAERKMVQKELFGLLQPLQES